MLTRRFPALITASGLVIGLFAGCTTNKMTTTVRSATEQLLLSTATDHALLDPGVKFFAGHKVFLDATYFDSYDSKYALGAIRDALSRAGALLEDSATNSEIIIEARSGALAIDDSDTLFGIPSMALPVPLAGSLQTPEVAFYESHKQRSVAKFALLALTRESHAHVYSSGPLDGNAYHKSSRLFFIAWTRTDLPEEQKNQQKAQADQTWFPQYDPANLPTPNAATKEK
jgi:hypothetical protein